MTVFKQLILNNLRGFQMKVALKTMTFCFCHQVVWNSSYKVGCGVAFCRNSTYFYGCHYYRAYVNLIYPPSLCFTCYFSEGLTVVSVYLTRGWFRVKLILVKKKHLFNRGNFKGWQPYEAGPPCASCPNNCEDKLCSK